MRGMVMASSTAAMANDDASGKGADEEAKNMGRGATARAARSAHGRARGNSSERDGRPCATAAVY